MAKRRIGFAAALFAGAVLAQAALAQAPPPGVFSEVQTAVGPRISPALEPATIRSRMVQLNTQKISAARRGREILKLNLFDDAIVEVQIKRVRPTRTGYFISGRPKGMEWGDVRLVVNGPVMVGTVETPEGTFTIRSGGSGRSVIRQIDPSKELFECGVEEASPPPAPPLPARPDNAISSANPPPAGAFSLPSPQADDRPTEDGSEIRVLVVYTPAVQEHFGGAPGARALVDLMIQSTNQAFEDSGINPRLVLAHSTRVNYLETAGGDSVVGTGKLALEDPNDGVMDEVHALRNRYAADLVHLLLHEEFSIFGGVAGIAGRMRYEDLSFEDDAFAATAVSQGSASEYTFAHETGHNLGLRHDRFTTNSRAIYPYAYGYVNKRQFDPGAPETARWRTLMAYPGRCREAGFDCQRLLRFSNPDQTYLGDPLGVAADSPITGPDGPSDARLTVNKTAPWAGSFRSQACTDFSVSPETTVASISGGEVVIQVDTSPGCLWEASSQAGFLRIASDLLSAGPGPVKLEIEANGSGRERSGSVTVAGKEITVRQLATTEGVCGRTTAVLNAIMGAAGFSDVAQCDEIADDDLAQVTSLSLSRQGLGSLKERDLAGLAGLRSLDLQGNQLARLPEGVFADLSNLEDLQLHGNLLTELPAGLFSGLSSLQNLRLDGNRLTELPEGVFADLSNLEDLQLDGNRLTELPAGLFSGLSSLTNLSVSDNRITRLPEGLFSGLSRLGILEINGNRLTELPSGLFSGLSRLWVLHIRDNRLTEFPAGLISGLSRLRVLYIDGNRLTELPEGLFSGLSRLSSLNISDNLLTELPAGLFSGLSGFSSLHVRDNLLTELPAGLFSGLSGFRTLDISANRFTELPAGQFSGLSNLQILFLHRNRWRELPAGLFSGLSNLESLVISESYLTELPEGIFADLVSLSSLNLSDNDLSSLPSGVFSGLTELRTLRLDGNRVNPLPLPISLEKVGNGGFKAIAPSGVPFTLVLPVTINDAGEIEGGASTVTISAGAVESAALRVERMAGTDEAVHVDIEALPTVPSLHDGYVLEKDETLPREILPPHAMKDAALTGLAVSAGDLLPAFAVELTTYATIVENTTPSVTITPTTRNADATVEFLNAQDGVLADADERAEGHQVSLDPGDNTIKVKVTAQDGADTRIYTLVVTRDGPAGVCGRTAEVRDEIVKLLDGIENCVEVTEDRLADIRKLDLRGKNISTLRSGDFAGLTQLVGIDLADNELVQLPGDVFSGLTALRSVLLSNNRLTSLPDGVFSGLTALASVWLHENRLTALPDGVFSGLTALEAVLLSDNRLTALPDGVFSGLTALEKVLLNRNSLTSLPGGVFEGLVELETLWLGRNRLDSLPPGIFSGLTSLEGLNLDSNQFTEFPKNVFRGLTSLKGLSLQSNPASNLPEDLFFGLSALERIALYGLPLTSLPESIFSGLAALEHIGIGGTRLTSLPAGIFSSLPALEELLLYTNAVRSLPAGIFSGLTKLRVLWLPENRLDTLPAGIFSDLSALERLNLQDNSLSSLPAGILSGLSALQDLYLANNGLSGLPPGIFSGLSSLAELDLRGNAIDPLPLSVSLEKAEESKFKAVAPTGAPFALALPVNISSTGTIEGDIDAVRIPAGEVESTSVGVTRVTGAEDAVTVNLGTLPTPPAQHQGYVLKKDGTLPRVILPGSKLAPLAQVTGVEVALGVEQLEVSWDAVSDADGYSVQWKSREEAYDEDRQVELAGSDTTSYTIAELTPGTQYTVRVIATKDNADDGEPSEEVTGKPTAQALAQVTGVAVEPGFEELAVSWDAVSDANGYTVQWKSGSEDYDEARQAVLTGVDTLSHTIADLSGGTQYTVRVIATKDNADEGPPSSEVTGTPKSSPPAQVRGLETAAGIERLDVTWTAVSDADGYTVQWKSGEEAYDEARQVELAGSDTTSHTIAGLTPGARYTVRVIATRANADDGMPSEEVTGTPNSERLAQVTGLEITPGIEQLEVSWEAVSDADGYTVQWKSGEEAYDEDRQAVIAGADTVSYTIAELMVGTQYTVRVIATKDNADEGPPSSEVTGTPKSSPPAQVRGLETAAGIERLDVTWTAVSDANGYKVQWKSGEEDYDGARQAVVPSGDTLSHTIADLSGGTEYTVRVLATKDNADDGLPSNEVTGIPKATPPAQVTGVAVEPGFEELAVSWDAVPDADGYKVQWKSGSQDYDEVRQVALLGGETTSYTIIDLTVDTEYTVRVIATKDYAEDGAPSEEVTATLANPDPDVNADGTLDGDDAQVMYQAYASEERVGDGESGGTAALRRTLLSGLAATANPSDDDLKAMLRRANVWRSVGVAVGGDINEDGAIDGDDAFVMYYAYEFADLVGDGETGGTARHRQHLLSSRANKDNPTDQDLKRMLRRANALRDKFG